MTSNISWAGQRRLAILAVLPLSLSIPLIAGCGGGGGGGGGGSSTPPGPTITLEGTVTDFGTGNTVSGATVKLKGTSRSTTTDGSGNYSLAGVPADSRVTIIFTDPSYPANPDDDSVTTGSTSPQTEDVNYPFSLAPP